MILNFAKIESLGKNQEIGAKVAPKNPKMRAKDENVAQDQPSSSKKPKMDLDELNLVTARNIGGCGQ
jgi:hypothetical protein